jgi:Flp pilus assembly protein TadG
MAIHRRRGGAAIEFALVLPVLLGLLFGIIEYGWMFLQQSNIVSAVREGVRLGVTYATDATPDPAEAAADRIEAVLADYAIVDATVVTAYEGASPDETLTVTVNVPYQPLIGWKGLAPDNLSASMTMLLELQD